jgi:ATP adenylyltransferase
MEYIRSLADEQRDGCFLCKYRDARDADRANHVLWRDSHTMVALNRFPYTNGHLLICPLAHKGDIDDLSEDESRAIWHDLRCAKRLLTSALGAHGFNVGINFGHCAGAGLPDHMHVHLVPRWTGDTNFMAVLGGVRVIPEGLDALFERLDDGRRKMGFPTVPGARP